MGNGKSQQAAAPAAPAPRAPVQRHVPQQSGTVGTIQRINKTIQNQEKRVEFLEKKVKKELRDAMAKKKAGNRSGTSPRNWESIPPTCYGALPILYTGAGAARGPRAFPPA